MNEERLLQLADAIETGSIEGLGFNMACFHEQGMADLSGRGCGTVGCIAAWANALWPKADYDDIEHPEDEAEDLLELKDIVASKLFFPPLDGNGYDATPAEAAMTIRKLVETGKVDWSHVGERG